MSGSTAEEVGGGVVGGTAGFFIAGPAGAAIGAGAGMSAMGAINGASAQAQVDETKADAERSQADQIAKREAANDAIRQTSTYQQKIDFASAFAGSGHSGTGIGSQLELQRQSDLQKTLNDNDAAFQEKQVLLGATLESNLASTTQTAGYVSAASTILGAAGGIAKGAGTPTTPQSLPNPSFTG